MQDNGAAALRSVAAAFKNAGGKDLRNEVAARMRGIGKPLGQKVIAEAAPGLPHRGGLSGRVARTKIGQTNSFGKNPAVTLNLKSSDGYDLGAMDSGQVRHPVFGRKTWVVQRIRPNLFTDPFQEYGPKAAEELAGALEQVVDNIQGATS